MPPSRLDQLFRSNASHERRSREWIDFLAAQGDLYGYALAVGFLEFVCYDDDVTRDDRRYAILITVASLDEYFQVKSPIDLVKALNDSIQQRRSSDELIKTLEAYYGIWDH